MTQRASLVAGGYQEFRIPRITLVWKAGLDTFQARDSLGSTATSVPQLYYMVDKLCTLPGNFDLSTMLAVGAIPRRFDDKNVKVAYKPKVMQSSMIDRLAPATQVAMGKTSPWLPTNAVPNDTTFAPSNVVHTGIAWWVRQSGVSVFSSNYDVEIILDFEFRKPRILGPTPTNAPEATEVFPSPQ